MVRDFDKELYIKQEQVEEYLKMVESSIRTKHISMEESLTSFINGVLDTRLSTLNNKCNTCIKKGVCKIWENLLERANILTQKDPNLEFTGAVVKCNNYQEKGK